MNKIITPLTILLIVCIMAFTPPQGTAELTSYSISLAVKDIKQSYDFYRKLGFKPTQGTTSLSQKWIVLSNGKTRIGLFQGMFPKNTITFNPENNRSVYKTLQANGLKPTNILNMNKDNGPCTFSLTDPDGNPILFDQH